MYGVGQLKSCQNNISEINITLYFQYNIDYFIAIMPSN